MLKYFTLYFFFLKCVSAYIICLIELNATLTTPKVLKCLELPDEFCVNIKKIELR